MTVSWIVIGAIAVAIVLMLLSRGPSVDRRQQRMFTDEDIRKAVDEGKKITAIKMYRELHGVDLKTAKEAIDAME